MTPRLVHGWEEMAEEDLFERWNPFRSGSQADAIEEMIHRRIADLRPERDRIEEFASKWGHLGTQRYELWTEEEHAEAVLVARSLPADSLAKNWRLSGRRFGESLQDWATAISKLKFMIRIWDWRRGQSLLHEGEVRRMICSRPRMAPHYTPWPLIVSSNSTDEMVDYLLEREINMELGHRFRQEIDVRNRRWICRLDSLLSNAYYRFAQEIMGHAFPSRCEHCGGWFNKVDPRRRVCSTSCRVMKSRRSKTAS